MKSLRAVILLALVAGFYLYAQDAKSGVQHRALEAEGIHNLFQLNDRTYSGSAPEGDEGFASLKKLGIKTIISVDGSKPDVERAHKFGLRYVHLPHGYDGIGPKTELSLVKAAETLPGPVFVHCHHGKHRGPTAAAIICMAESGWTPAQAENWLHVAGTATNYAGLFETVRKFRPPSVEELKAAPNEFPELAKVSGLIDAMVEIDGIWDNLKAVRKAGYQPPKENPDIQPANETVILWEHFREAQRLDEAKQHGREFIDHLKSAEVDGRAAETLLRKYALTPTPQIRGQLDDRFDALNKRCADCHKAYRDHKP